MGRILVEMDGKEREVEIKGRSIRVDRLLELLDIYPETAVVVKDGKLLCDDERLSDGDRVKVVVATSKG
ncbi:thiamine biosynthesis protein ThiS [Phorcysia thermohydrogeniphila]|uniref:Sulfur carrier protein n=1 Tax=Phorcysia thermohydrogeniphila TaxID=936138 RepID=A0A4R1GB07_9BACT|nr:thiamine biosynthesis protein ThiS [Phorcysia thermohydrogeniphila]TCK03861.1 sulfur carrier protein [Phorcysia thermohydrogeniphila]